MKTVIFIAFVVCVVATAVFLLLRSFNSMKSDGHDNQLKNVNHGRSAEQSLAEPNTLTPPAEISKNNIQRMVDRLFVQEDNDSNLEELKLIGDRAAPFIITELKSDRAFKKMFSDDEFAWDAESPFERLCELLQETCPPAAVDPLTRYISHPDEHFRKQAGLAIGNIGTDDCINPILELLGDEEDYVRAYAMMGIERGMDGGRCTRTFLDSVFPALKSLLDSDEVSTGGHAPQLMLAINRGRAIPILLSDEFFKYENAELHYIIEALNEANVVIPHGKLLPLIDALQPLLEKFPHDYQLAMALSAYRRNPDENTKRVLSTLSKCPEKIVASMAADELASLSSVVDPLKFVFDQLDSHGWHSLSVEQQHYYAVFVYNSEVNNGGHSQYFFNSLGDHHASALAGLRAIGSTERSLILLQALQVFGKNGPSVDNQTRREQLATLSRRQNSKLDSFNLQYYKCDENIDVLLSSYAFANKEYFTPVR